MPPPLEVPEPAADVKIEPIAMRVPAECFYARFGSFANFLWLQDTLAKWGGDVQNLIALRGLDRGMSSRMEKQLVLKQTVLSRMLGDTVIADVAIIGADMFFREGASYGILFHARNNFALSASFAQQRQERLEAGGVTEAEGQDRRPRRSPICRRPTERSARTTWPTAISISSPRRSIWWRGFWPRRRAKDRWARRRSSATPAASCPSAATTPSGSTSPTLSSATSPARTIAWRWRGGCRPRPTSNWCNWPSWPRPAKPGRAATIEQLKAASLLPPEFGPLPDGSRIVLEGGEVYDSVRGRRGAFLPVGDMPVDKITRAELAEYHKFADFYRAKWGRMDPIIAGVKRTALKDNREQVVVDVLMSPFAPQHFKLLKQWLGPADDQQLAPIPGDMAAVELVLTDQRIFAGLRDVGRPPDRRHGDVGSRWEGSAISWWATSARPANWACWAS